MCTTPGSVDLCGEKPVNGIDGGFWRGPVRHSVLPGHPPQASIASQLLTIPSRPSRRSRRTKAVSTQLVMQHQIGPRVGNSLSDSS